MDSLELTKEAKETETDKPKKKFGVAGASSVAVGETIYIPGTEPPREAQEEEAVMPQKELAKKTAPLPKKKASVEPKKSSSEEEKAPVEEKKKRTLGEIKIAAYHQGDNVDWFDFIEHEEFSTTSEAERWLTSCMENGSLKAGNYSIIRLVKTFSATVETIRKVSIKEA